MDMKMKDRRAMPRLRVQFRTAFSDASQVKGIGLTQDLSLGGCRIESPAPVVRGLSLELQIHVPDLESPILIEGASVQWVSGMMFGLAFFRMTDAEKKRLGQVIKSLKQDTEVP